jgi:hypothetical protein
MTAVPETRYTRSADGTNLAYQVIGDGPLDVTTPWSEVRSHAIGAVR